MDFLKHYFPGGKKDTHTQKVIEGKSKQFKININASIISVWIICFAATKVIFFSWGKKRQSQLKYYWRHFFVCGDKDFRACSIAKIERSLNSSPAENIYFKLNFLVHNVISSGRWNYKTCFLIVTNFCPWPMLLLLQAA